MSFQVCAYSPEGERIKIGLGHTLLTHSLEDRDELRNAYLRFGSKWTVEVEDGDGRVMDWSDAEAQVP